MLADLRQRFLDCRLAVRHPALQPGILFDQLIDRCLQRTVLIRAHGQLFARRADKTLEFGDTLVGGGAMLAQHLLMLGQHAHRSWFRAPIRLRGPRSARAPARVRPVSSSFLSFESADGLLRQSELVIEVLTLALARRQAFAYVLDLGAQLLVADAGFFQRVAQIGVVERFAFQRVKRVADWNHQLAEDVAKVVERIDTTADIDQKVAQGSRCRRRLWCLRSAQAFRGRGCSIGASRRRPATASSYSSSEGFVWKWSKILDSVLMHHSQRTL